MDTILKLGSQGYEVKELKVLLNKKMGSTLDVNNENFGSSTQAVVKQFQKKFGLIQDGVIGSLSWKTLLANGSEVKDVKCFLTSVESYLTSQVGVKEKTGKNDGEEVEKYLKSVGLGKGYAWCQAFLYWGFSKAAEQLKVTNPMPKTAGVLDNWRKSKSFQVSKGQLPKFGDVFTMDFGKGTGHAGFVISVDNGYINTVEGNTSADPTLPSEDREGQGVYLRRRKISSINNGFIRYSS